MIRGARESCTDAGLDADHLSVDIDDGKQLMRLFRSGRKWLMLPKSSYSSSATLYFSDSASRTGFRDEFKLRKSIPRVIDDGLKIKSKRPR